MSLFKRVATVHIGEAGNLSTIIAGVRISFMVDKNATRTVNTADVIIYNLKESTRSAISDVNNKIILMAGYEEHAGAELLFQGDVDKFQRIKLPPDDLCKISAGDGLRILRETEVTISVASGYAGQEILDQIIDHLEGMTVRPYSLASDVDFANGWSFVGTAADALDKICRSLDASWSVQNEEIQIVEQQGNNQTEAIVISSTTGLIKTPEKIDSIGQELDGTKKPPGWRIHSLLQPSVEPRGVISIESEVISGLLTVENVQHMGDTHRQTWHSIIEAFEEEQAA